MCSVKVEVCEFKAMIGPIEGECGNTNVAVLGAKSEEASSEPPTPKMVTPALPRPTKQDEEDDPLTYLTALFSLALDFDDSDDGSDCDSDDDSAPPSPRAKTYGDFTNKYCFYASGVLYYFDDLRRVYTGDGTFVCECPFDLMENDLLTPNFFIDGLPYWFDVDGLLSQDADGTFARVHSWPSSSQVLPLDNLLGQPPVSHIDPAVFVPDSNPGSFYAPESIPTAMPTPDYYTVSKSKTEVPSPEVNPNTLEQSFQGGAKPLIWSPTSSTHKSPLFSTTVSREASMGPSLFPEPKPPVTSGHPIIAKWQHELVKAKESETTARPVKKPAKEERRRCPECNKLFRRPSSLDDHLNVHSGKKPHICPFEGCNTGFATKSNMKRHFTTHRVGALERYRPGMIPRQPCEPAPTKTGKAPRGPTATYNSKSYHNGRFRIDITG